MEFDTNDFSTASNMKRNMIQLKEKITQLEKEIEKIKYELSNDVKKKELKHR